MLHQQYFHNKSLTVNCYSNLNLLMKLFFYPLIITYNNLLFMICNINVVNISFLLRKSQDILLSSQYFHNCWSVSFLQIKVKYNKVVKILWKCCVILCVSRIFFFISQFLLSQIHSFIYSFLELNFCILFCIFSFLYILFKVKTHSFTPKKKLRIKIIFILYVLGSSQFFFKL